MYGRASRLVLAIAILASLPPWRCTRNPDLNNVAAGSEVTIETRAGTELRGRIAEVQPGIVVVEHKPGEATSLRRDEIRRVMVIRRAGGRAPLSLGPGYREVTLPAGTVLPAVLETTLASDTSRVEDPVRARVLRSIVINGIEAVPTDSELLGVVTAVQQSGRVRGRARIAFRFHTLRVRGIRETYDISTSSVARVAASTVKQDVAKVVLPAAGGAIVGGIAGGKKGAAIGSAVGGGAGTAVVLTTRGKDVRLGAGARLTVRLQAPLAVRGVPVKATRPGSDEG